MVVWMVDAAVSCGELVVVAEWWCDEFEREVESTRIVREHGVFDRNNQLAVTLFQILWPKMVDNFLDLHTSVM